MHSLYYFGFLLSENQFNDDNSQDRVLIQAQQLSLTLFMIINSRQCSECIGDVEDDLDERAAKQENFQQWKMILIS